MVQHPVTGKCRQITWRQERHRSMAANNWPGTSRVRITCQRSSSKSNARCGGMFALHKEMRPALLGPEDTMVNSKSNGTNSHSFIAVVSNASFHDVCLRLCNGNRKVGFQPSQCQHEDVVLCGHMVCRRVKTLLVNGSWGHSKP